MLYRNDGREVSLLISVDVVLDGFCAEYIRRQSLHGLLATRNREFLSPSDNTEKLVEEAIDDASHFMERIKTYFQGKEDGVFLLDIYDDETSFGIISVLLGSGMVKYAGLKCEVDEEPFKEVYKMVEVVHGISDPGSCYKIMSLESLKDPNLNLIVPTNQVSRAHV